MKRLAEIQNFPSWKVLQRRRQAREKYHKEKEEADVRRRLDFAFDLTTACAAVGMTAADLAAKLGREPAEIQAWLEAREMPALDKRRLILLWIRTGDFPPLLPQVDWSAVDWSKTTKALAAETGYTLYLVTKARARHAPHTLSAKVQRRLK